MSAPFFKFGFFGDEFSLIVAFVIGIGFGFFLERAGFGSARKLTAQFYLTDLSVFKVMFTAILTAMLGVFYLSWAGFVDLSLVYKGSTYLIPQTIGGAFLGFGFVIGGYCPGTSVVAAATGRLDGVLFIVGVMIGIFGFGTVFPAIQDFYYSTDMGVITLPELFNMSYGLVMLQVVLIALGGFYGSELLERLHARKMAEA